MAAVELLETPEYVEPYLRLVGEPIRQFRNGAPLAERRQARVLRHRRRQRVLVALVLCTALAILAMPGHTFGATDGAGLSNDFADSSVLASGMNYVVQPGDTVNSLAREMNPADPSVARAMLVHELGSSVVVPGEHVLIP
ncbi:MAG: hypothetical protein WCA31_00430 [Acidimicrobiales bacterium]